MKKDLVIQHYKKPNNWGEISNGAFAKAENVSCGDSVVVYLKLENGVVNEAKFTGMGCSICLGTTDILLDIIKGKSVKEIKQFSKNLPLELIEMDGDSPRKTCALLSIQAVFASLKGVE
jgi:nitrogen fixation NifU-like protein